MARRILEVWRSCDTKSGSQVTTSVSARVIGTTPDCRSRGFVIVPTEHQEVLMDVDTPEDYDWIQRKLHNANSSEGKKRSLS